MNIALIGYGYWGPNLAKNIAELKNTRLVGICEVNNSRLERARQIYGSGIDYTSDYKKIISSPEVDALAIATQTEPSYQIVIDALEAGKHVFIEKPIASTVERAQNIKKVAERKGLAVHCDHIMIFNPVIRYIKGMLDNGELGDIMYIDVSRINLGPIRKDVNAMLDLAVHDVAVIDFLSGGQEPVDFSVMGQALFGKQESITYLTLKYSSFIAHIKSSWVSPMKERRMMIAGTKKMVIFDDIKISEKLAIYNHGIDIKSEEEYGIYEFETRTGDIIIPNIPNEDSLRNSIAHFVSCVEQGRISLSGPEHALRVMKVLEWGIEGLKRSNNQ